ncbi:MAG: FtsQ-type POTRA domain-containing protein, partial [Syntrophobacteraceae bacterium]
MLILGAGLSRLYYALLDAPWLKVEEIEIAGLKKLDRNRALDVMGVSRGECILNLRMGSISDRLKGLSIVKTASVRLDLPGRIVAEVIEREPFALIKGDELFMMDGEGILFDRAVSDEHRSVPLITGISGAGLKEGDSIPARHLNRIRELVVALNGASNWLPATSVVECRWSTVGFTLVLGERGVPVEVGHENFSGKLARLKRVVATLNERQWNELVTRIDLDYPGKAYLEGQFPLPKPAQG